MTGRKGGNVADRKSIKKNNIKERREEKTTDSARSNGERKGSKLGMKTFLNCCGVAGRLAGMECSKMLRNRGGAAAARGARMALKVLDNPKHGVT